MKEESLWQNADMPRFMALQYDLQCDVLVVGGGITGLTAAYLLARSGKSVCVVERGRIGGGDTGCTTAHLTCVTDTRLSELVHQFGADAARLIWGSGEAAIHAIEQISRAENIQCGFRRIPGFLHGSILSEEDESESLQKDRQLATELGFEAGFMQNLTVVGKQAVRFANQARFHPLQYLNGLCAAIQRSGGRIFEQTEATHFNKDPRFVTANGRRVDTEHIVIATHVPLVGEAGLVSSTLFQTKLAAYSSYAIGAQIPKDQYSEAIFWDTTDPYYYLRIDRGESSDYAIFGGGDHKTGQEDDPVVRFDDLEVQLKRLIPEAAPDRRWSGQVIETNDGLPYIGETAPGQFVATGFGGNGMTFGTLGGMMACDSVLGRENPWAELFAVERRTLRSAWDYVKENIDYPWYLLRDRLSGNEDGTIESIQRGEGRVLLLNRQRVACARGQDGQLEAVSALCPHMGCIVHWNNAGKTWDCPCHGSRFSISGHVIAGPAESPLEKISLSDVPSPAQTQSS